MCPKIRILMILSIVACSAMFVGCEGPEGPQGPAGSQGVLPVYVIGRISHRPIYYYRGKEEVDSATEARVDVYNCPTIPSAEINGIRIPPSDPFYRGCSPFRFYDDNLSISCGDSVELLVTYPKSDGTSGTAHANIMLPSQFEITSPDTSYDTISVGDSLVFLWTASDGADAYLADFQLWYGYWDTAGTRQYFEYSADDIALMDTSITFSQAQLFPNLEEIDSLEYGYGSFDVWAMNGPTPEEDQGNVTGDAIGFFNGWTYGGYVRFVVRGSSLLIGEIVESESPAQKLAEQRARHTSF